MNHKTEHNTGIFAIGTLLATDDLVADEIVSQGLKVKGRQLGWVTAEGTLIQAYRMLLTTRVGDRVVWLLARGEARSVEKFRDLVRTVDWNNALYAGGDVRVDVTGKIGWMKKHLSKMQTLENKTTIFNIDTKFNNDLYRDANDIFGKNNSQRQFYTVPGGSIPNDQEAFTKWLYQTPPTCKEGNKVQCFANIEGGPGRMGQGGPGSSGPHNP